MPGIGSEMCEMTALLRKLDCHVRVLGTLMLVALLVSSAGAISLGELEEWNTTFDKGAYTDLFAVAQTGDGDFLFGGFGYAADSDSALLIRTGAGGTELGSTLLEGDSIVALAPLEDGGAVAGLYTVEGDFLAQTDWNNTSGSSTLVRTDASGAPQWRAMLDGARVTDLAVLPSGDIAATGWLWKQGGGSDSFLSLYDQDGEEQWTRTYVGGAARSLALSPDGGFVLGGTEQPGEQEPTDSWVMKTDGSGEEIWFTELLNRSCLVCRQDPAGGYILGGSLYEALPGYGPEAYGTDAWVAKIDEDGSLVWERQVPGLMIDAIADLPGTGYALAGRWSDSPQLQIINEEGEVVDGKVWNGWNGRLSAVAATADGGVVASGWSGMNGRAEGWAVKFAALPSSAPQESPTSPAQTPGFGLASAGAALAVLVLVRGRNP
jgi:hypothetical protein